MNGPVYRYHATATDNSRRWPEYWDGRWFLHNNGGDTSSTALCSTRPPPARRAADLRRQPAQHAVVARVLHGLQVRARRRALRADLRRLLPRRAERRHLPLRLRRRRADAGRRAAGGPDRRPPGAVLDRRLGRRLLPVGVRRRRDLDRGQPDAHLRRGQALHGQADGHLRRRRDGHRHRRRRRAGAGRRDRAGHDGHGRPGRARHGGTYTKPVTVTLAATDRGGSGVDRTEYRINGGDVPELHGADHAHAAGRLRGRVPLDRPHRQRRGAEVGDVHDRVPENCPTNLNDEFDGPTSIRSGRSCAATRRAAASTTAGCSSWSAPAT